MMIKYERTNSLRFFVVLLFVIGMLQMDMFAIDWIYVSGAMAIHTIGAIMVFAMLIVPYTIKHGFEMFYVHKYKNKDGIVLFVFICLITASGVYLFLVGNRGGDIFGIVAFWVHLVCSFLLTGLLFYHIYNTRKQAKELLNYFQPIVVAVLLFAVNDN